ncbi:cytochrome bc1 complex cytochrome b subunit [Microtetraspora fusca]|uniref:cytochrome bc1 complex cytochrome b subunit n=1 Tax=Microtetraspora fusca TaxID=1997 RepID=UPI000836FDB6|nr:ubiquinol-cytochrome c reductase cytochrome b subunit [Microtetraspora fusca]
MITRWAVRRVLLWLDGRVRIASVTRKTLAKVFPDHWTFMLGEIALYSFVSLVATGVFLTLFFEPSPAETVYTGAYGPMRGVRASAAYASAVTLSWDVRAGLLMRQTHHWSALVFLSAIVAHLSRIFLTGAFRKPREINWVIGLTMFLLGIATGFAGYSVPDDLLSGTGLRIAAATLLSVPVVGPWAAFLLFGGGFPGTSIIPRLYILHVLLLPGAIAALIGAHLAILIRQKHTHFPGPGRTQDNVVGSKMWPTYGFRSLALMCAVFAVTFGLGGLVQINPVWVWGPFRPSGATSPAQPDWFLAWVEGALRLYPPYEFRIFGYLVPAPFVPGVVMPALTFLVLYLWPWLDRRLTRGRGRHQVLDRPRDSPARVAAWAWGASFYGLLLLASSDDVVARYFQIPVFGIVRTMRIVVLVVPVAIGAVAYVLARALREDPEATLLDLRWRRIAAVIRRRPPDVEGGERRAAGAERPAASGEEGAGA